MSDTRALGAVLVAVCLALAGCAGGGVGTGTDPGTPTAAGTATATMPGTGTATDTGGTSTPTDGEERATVTTVDANGTTLATVSVVLAVTDEERYTGLSDTDALEFGEGMLFVYGQEGRHTYVMRDMDFPLDIVFVGANGTVTAIHHAPTEPGESGGDLTPYPGIGQYVLEVPRGWTNETGLDVGDEVRVPDGVHG
jgi:uncharacterized membrane protein (UPF0127 family)